MQFLTVEQISRSCPPQLTDHGAGAFDASAGPNCGDADADGIPNIAERIRGYFERGSGRPDAGKKGTCVFRPSSAASAHAK